MPKKTRLQPTGKLITYLDTNPLWVQYFGEGGSGVWGQRHIRKVKELLPSPDLVLDVGANIGQTAVYYADWANEVWSFEPLPHLYEILVENLQQNGLTNVKPYNLAVGAQRGDLHMKVTPTNDGASFVSRAGWKTLQPVRAVSLDSLQVPEGRRIEFIKIDVEGYEPFVIEGARELIRDHRPILQVEAIDKHLIRHGWDSLGVVRLMESMGYRAQLLGGRSVDSSSERKWQGDIFFLPSGFVPDRGSRI